ncbi:MAG: DNA primase [Burkholderiales bacterium]|nr:MAG: DNA primase [Burkholderiales bacterium]
MIPQGFIQDLLARVDLVDVVGRYVQLKKAGQNYLGLCPFHGEKSPSFTVSPSKQFFHCFGCGAHGTAVGFLMEHRGLGFVEAVRELAQQVGMQVPEGPADQAQATGRLKGLAELLQRASDHYRHCLKGSDAAIQYLKGRGLQGATAARFALGFSADEWTGLAAVVDSYDDPQLVEAGLVIANEGKRYDRFRGRVMFPIRNRRGWVIGFGARALDGAEPKYLNSPETPLFHKGRELYGLFEAQEAIRRRRRAIVCEGYLDVIQLAQAGFEESVAALGTAVTSHHVAELLRLTEHVIFAFDGDAAGRKAARRALEAALPVLGDTRRIEFVLLPEGEDPDSLVRLHGADAFAAELGQALPLSRWFIRSLSEGKDLGTAEGRAAMLAEAKPLVSAMPAGALRMQLLNELAGVARSAPAEVENLFGLRPWRRLPEARPSQPRRQPADTADLKQHILQRLLAFPELVDEFDGAIAAEFAEGESALDRQVIEVWRAASSAEGLTCGSLQELLAESDFAAQYREAATRELLAETDADAARLELAGAFAKLELRRLNGELEALAGRQPLDAAALARFRELSERRARLMAGASAHGRGGAAAA